MILSDADKKEIRKRLEGLKNPVTLAYFTQKLAGECRFCSDTEQLLREVAALSDAVKLEVFNFVTDKEAVKRFGIARIPATVIMGKKDSGIRMYGIPSGYEFAAFLETLIRVSAGDSGLSAEAKKKCAEITVPVHIQVFTTPTCPYCPGAALTAALLAIENEQITSDVVEISEFPTLAQKYSVMGVPKVVINETHSFEGALPETLFVDHVLNAVKEK